MVSSAEKLPLCYVLLLILGVMGLEDLKKPGELDVERGEASGKLAAPLGDRSEGTKPGEGPPQGEGVIEGKGREMGAGREGLKTWGEVAGKIDSGQNLCSAGVGNEMGGKLCGGDPSAGRRRKRDGVPQTRNPTETNGRGLGGMDPREEITREDPKELGERAPESERRKSLSTNEPNAGEEEEEGRMLEEELREAEMELRGEELKEELALQREVKKSETDRVEGTQKEEKIPKECEHPECGEKDAGKKERNESRGVEKIAADEGAASEEERQRGSEEKNNIRAPQIDVGKYGKGPELAEMREAPVRDAGVGDDALKLEEGGRKASKGGNFSMRGNARSDGSVSNKERGFPVAREDPAGSGGLHYGYDERDRGGQEEEKELISDEERKIQEDELEAELKRTESLEKKTEDGAREGKDSEGFGNSEISREKVTSPDKEKGAVRDPGEGKKLEKDEGAKEGTATGDVTGEPDFPETEAPEVDSSGREYEDVHNLKPKDWIESSGDVKQGAVAGENVVLDVPFVKGTWEDSRETVGAAPPSRPCPGTPSLRVSADVPSCSEKVEKRDYERVDVEKEGQVAKEEVSIVGERESPLLMEKKSQRRLKGDDGEVWEGKQWDPGERNRGTPVKWTAEVRDSHLPRTATNPGGGKTLAENEGLPKRRVIEDAGLEDTWKDRKDNVDENEESFYEKEIESLKTSKEYHPRSVRKKEDPHGKHSEGEERRRPDQNEFSNINSGSNVKEDETDFDGRTFSEGGAPVVTAEGEGKGANAVRGFGLGDEIHQGALPSAKTIPNSMLHRILEANLDSRSEPNNQNNFNEAGAAKQLMRGSRAVDRLGSPRKEKSAVESHNGEFESEGSDIKGPRRMLMSVSEKYQTTREMGYREETDEPELTTRSAYDLGYSVKPSKVTGQAMYKGRNLIQPAWKSGKGVKFVARNEAIMFEKGFHGPRGSLIKALKYSGNASLTAGKLEVAKKRARSRGVVIGDKIYRVGKYGLVAVSMVESPTIPTKRHGPRQLTTSDDVIKLIDSVTNANTDSMTPTTVTVEDDLGVKTEPNSSKSKAWKSLPEKDTPAVSTESNFATVVTHDEQVTLESPPTLTTAEVSKDGGSVLGNQTVKQATTLATPAEKELGLPDWKMAPLSDSSAHPDGCEGGVCVHKFKPKEEYLGYTRLQIRRPRMLDASGFGRGRGTHLGTSIVSSSGGGKRSTLTVGMILPYTAFGQRDYTKATNNAIAGLSKSKTRKLEFIKKYTFTPQQVRPVMMQLTPSPTAILNSLCKEFLSVNVSAILYLMNYEKYGRSTASAQYFLQLAGYLGIPVIAWNADNSGLERRASQSSLQLQLAPSLEHQTAAMLSILERYKWHQFSIVTSQIAGHDDFVQAIRERILEMQDVFKFTILNAVLVTKPSDLSELVNSESRVVLLYCTKEEALKILSAAADYQITGENYVWVVAQSVIENKTPYPQFPIGMLGVHFDTGMPSLVQEISTAIKVYAYGVEDFINDPRNEKLSLNTQLSCEGAGDSRWKVGDRFFKYLRNVSVEAEHGKPNIEFTPDGVLKAAELKILNLRPGVSRQLKWEEIGVWKSWEREGLDIKDIVWPGGSHTPPQGVPEKFHMRITFLEEPPYINVAPPDPITGKCSINRGVLCRFAAETDMSGMDMSQAHRNASYYQCCSGFCIDLLEKFSEELGFTYELVRVEDGKWGTLENGKWNGLIADLINRKTDMVMTSLMINSDREAVVDFTVPFMESGIAIVVAKRTGIISPTAFLEPFDSASWMLVGLVAIQVSAFTIFLFEWLSPSGFNMKVAPSTNHRFSLFRTYWLVWAVLFQAAVHVDCPKGFTARFMTNVWAMFAVVFLAIYTANLAAFMITREEFHEFSGIDDHRLAKPFSHKPMFKFGTIPWGHTDSTLKKYFREMHAYMKRHNRTIVGEGIEAVLSGELDAFIYDGTVLDYLVSQDEDCRLLTVGSWYAMTGYGIAFQRNSKYVRMFNQRLLDFRENGDLERLRRYWMTGSCKPGKQERKSSDPLALEQFLSAFLLLMSGILLAAFLLLLEHLYFKYVRHHLARTDRGGCCALVSLSMGKSLTFRGAVYEAQDMYRNNRRGPQQHQLTSGHRAFSGIGRNCNCSYCEGLHTLWATRRELEACRLRIRHLEKQMEAHGIRPLPPPPPQSLPSLLPPPGSPGNRRFLNDEDALRTRDMTRNHVSSTEYCGQLYRPCRTEIAEMETVL